MGTKTFFFDFDETLVDTSELWPYRQTAEGRSFIANYPENINTKLIDNQLVPIFNALAKRNLAAIATNSPQHYTKALLNKHGFSTEIPIYFNLHKPCHHKLSCVVRKECAQVDNALYIGDSAADILAAHGCRIPSVAVTWGNTSTPSKLKKAEPTKIVKRVKDLKTCIRSFKNEEIIYEKRFDPRKFIFIADPKEDTEIQYYSLVTYYPTRHHLFYRSMSNEILRFKDIKKFSIAEISNRVSADYFYDGEIKKGLILIEVFDQFYRKLVKFIDDLDLKGKSYAIAAPNSAPEYCYKSDVNQIMVNQLNRKIFNIESAYRKRILFRVFPKRESHLDGSRNDSEHYETIGAKETAEIPANVKNLIIFDDVATTHTQITCLAKILRTFFDFDGSLIGITLGQTTD